MHSALLDRCPRLGNHLVERHNAAAEVANALHVGQRYAVGLPLRHGRFADAEVLGELVGAAALLLDPFDEFHAVSLGEAKRTRQSFSKPGGFSLPFTVKDYRRKLFEALLKGPPYHGDRVKFGKAAELSKGRISQLLDSKKPFGDLAAHRLEEKLNIPGYFDPRPPPAPSVVTPMTADEIILAAADILAARRDRSEPQELGHQSDFMDIELEPPAPAPKKKEKDGDTTQ